MKHEMRLHTEPFELIKAGKQLIETRLYDEKRQQIQVGDQIVFLKRPECEEQLVVEVIGLSIFKTFKDLFQAIDKSKFGYSEGDTLEDQVNCMRKYYSNEEENKFGVVGIHIEVADT